MLWLSCAREFLAEMPAELGQSVVVSIFRCNAKNRSCQHLVRRLEHVMKVVDIIL